MIVLERVRREARGVKVLIAVAGLLGPPLALAGPAEAATTTTILRPDGLVGTPEWLARIDRDGSGPNGSEGLPIGDGWKTLDDNVQQPTDPDPDSQVNADWIAANGPNHDEEVTIADTDLTGREVVAGSKLWFHANTNNGTRLRVGVDWNRDGAADVQMTIPAGSARKWYSLAIDPPTAKVVNLQVKFTSLDNGGAWVRAAYVAAEPSAGGSTAAETSARRVSS